MHMFSDIKRNTWTGKVVTGQSLVEVSSAVETVVVGSFTVPGPGLGTITTAKGTGSPPGPRLEHTID